MGIQQVLETNGILMLDGGMGTMLQNAGLPLGVAPETYNLSHPEIVSGIHQAYIKAGSQVVFSNTFGKAPALRWNRPCRRACGAPKRRRSRTARLWGWI